MRDFMREETVEVYVEVRNQADTLVDPDTSITVTILDSANTEIVAATGMTKDDTGKYVYYYTIGAAVAIGWWTALVIVTDGTKVTRIRGGFKVVA